MQGGLIGTGRSSRPIIRYEQLPRRTERGTRVEGAAHGQAESGQVGAVDLHQAEIDRVTGRDQAARGADCRDP